jgi:hypothetical protein
MNLNFDQTNSALGFGQYNDTATAAVAQLPLSQQYGELDNNLSRLRESLICLEQRLSPVLGIGTPVPSGVDANAAKDRDLSPFASSLRNDNTRLRDALKLIDSIINRLEV